MRAVTPWIMVQTLENQTAELEGLKGVEESSSEMNSFSTGSIRRFSLFPTSRNRAGIGPKSNGS
jgi:hypothetical protein